MAGFTFHGRSLCEQGGCPGPTLAQLSAMLLAASINWGGLCQVQLHPNPSNNVGEGSDNLLQYSCLRNPMDKGVWQVTVHGVTKSRT